MSQSSQTPFARSLQINKNVIGALMMREIISRYGRQNLGFLWMVLEPLIFSVLISTLWTLRGSGRMSGLPILEFMMTGFPLLNLWRGVSNRAIGVVQANAGLLFHARVRILDVFIARSLVDVFGYTLSYIVILILFYYTGYMQLPDDPLYMVCAWVLMAWFGFALGLILGAMSERSEVAKRLWAASGFIWLTVSGTFFLVRSLPPQAMKIALYVPMIHGSEMLRHGYFGAHIVTYENVAYLITWNLILTFVGLLMVQRYNKGVEQS